jgi:hypothetical protein
MRAWGITATVLRVGAASFAGLVALAAGLRAMGLLPEKPELDTAAWVIALVIIGVDNVGTLFTRGARRRRAVRDKDIEKALMALLITIAKGRDLRFEELGASVFVASRWDRFARRGRVPKRLKRIVRFRPADYPQQSGVAWTPGKGAVGEAWTKKKTAVRDWNAVARKWGEAELDQAGFETLPKSTRQGFTLDEFCSIVGKYSEIIAEPVWHTGKERSVIAVVSIDRSYIADDANFKVHLNTTDTRDKIAATALTISGTLSPKNESA